MSVTAARPPKRRQAGGVSCALCNAPLAEDQEWCLECGAARTRITRPPDWRIPVGIVVIVVVIAAGIFALVISALSNNTGTENAGSSGKHAAASIARWAPGLDGWTVILAGEPSASAANAAASTAIKAGVKDVGVLATSRYPAMYAHTPYDVFAGRYPSYAAAQTAATTLTKQGQPGARPSVVQRPGGP